MQRQQKNPSFALNNALLSRLRTLQLSPLKEKDLKQLLAHCQTEGFELHLSQEAEGLLIDYAQGDGRCLLNMVEHLLHVCPHETIDAQKLSSLLQKKSALYDKKEDMHFNLISALHKSIRGSDPDAALYYLARMLSAGEDPQFLARRLIRTAVEDVGLADSQALQICISAWQAFHQLGSPEGDLALAQAVVYLALSPKSNALYTAYKSAERVAQDTAHLSPPKTILNVPTALMKECDYAKGYQYDHDRPLAFSGQEYFPPELGRQEFYHPKEYGLEKQMRNRLDYFKTLRERLNQDVD